MIADPTSPPLIAVELSLVLDSLPSSPPRLTFHLRNPLLSSLQHPPSSPRRPRPRGPSIRRHFRPNALQFGGDLDWHPFCDLCLNPQPTIRRFLVGKQVTDRQGAAELVASAAETHAARIADGFQATFADCLSGKEKMPDIALLVALFARKLRRTNAELVAASDALDKELADDAAPRAARDEAAAALTAEVVDIRAVVESTFGMATLKSLGLDGKTEVEPKAILAQARKLSAALSEPARKWPKPLRKGVKVDPSAWGADLDAWIPKLEKALKDVARETREAQAAQDKRDRALSANDDVFTRVARALSAAFIVAGDDTLAAKVRPSARRPGTVSDEKEEGSADDNPTEASTPNPPKDD